jgi:type I restriction enzyme S subunit
MNNVTTHKKLLVPQLRFKEFDWEWNKKAINSFASKLKVGFVGTCEPYYTDKVDGVLLVRTGNLKGVNIELDEEKYVTKEFHTKNLKSQIKPNDLLLARHGGNGEICRVPFDFPIANCLNIVILRTNSAVDTAYFQMVYSTFLVQSQIAAVTAGSTQVVINTKEIGKLKVCFPNLPEQQKIATFLTAVDQKIQQLSSKKEQLEKYKKGAMQQLFSQELRFKDDDGNDFADWEEKTLGEVYSFFSTNSFSRDNLNYENGEVQNIHYGDIHTKFPLHFDIKNELVPFINSSVNLSKIKEENYCQEGDLVIADASEDYNDIGKAIEIVNLKNKKVLAGLHTFLARPKNNQIYIGFSGFLMQPWSFRKQVMTIAQGTKVLGLATVRMKELKIQIPSLKEQQKIAAYLSSLDAKIEAVGTQIKNTQEFKKGLLQQLFV